MDLQEEISWAFGTRLEETNCQEFVSRLPDILFYAEIEAEKAHDSANMKRIIWDAMKAGIVLDYKEGRPDAKPEPIPPKDPKAPEYQLDAACKEKLIGEQIELWEWDSLASQRDKTVAAIKEKMWAAKKMLEKRQEL